MGNLDKFIGKVTEYTTAINNATRLSNPNLPVLVERAKGESFDEYLEDFVAAAFALHYIYEEITKTKTNTANFLTLLAISAEKKYLDLTQEIKEEKAKVDSAAATSDFVN